MPACPILGSQCQGFDAQGSLDEYSPTDLEATLRFLLADSPVELLALPELLELQNDSATCHDLLSFMKERPNVFKVSKDDLGFYKTGLAQTSSFLHESTLSPSLGETFNRSSGHDSAQVISLEDALRGGEVDRSLGNVSHQVPSIESGEEGGQPAHFPDAVQGLFSYLISIIKAADGSIALGSLEKNDDCKARFLLTGDLGDYAPEDFREDLLQYLRENSETFLLWPSSDGSTMVSLVGHTARAKSSSRWSKALRQVNCDREAEIPQD